MAECTDQVVGDILSSWRYDISGISPEMRIDYEEHLESCDHCRRRQRLHRTIDVALIGISTLSILAFVFALAVIHHIEPLRNWAVVGMHLEHRHLTMTLQTAAALGLLVSLVSWVLVAVATPAPVYITGVALAQARVLQERIPEEFGGRSPRNVA
ncbi:MAG TPA: hypothetical protein VHT28_05160 [Silvibacterium sp.]|jgi:hypothetical protein|nr:hypothetical protein [Silvibacterium sp.]